MAAAVFALAVVGVSACGSTDPTSTASSTRGAEADTTCAEQAGSDTQYFTFMNDLDSDVTLEVPRASWSCGGYSGVSTPGNLNGRVIAHPGPQPRIRMETYFSTRSYPDTRFTITFKAGPTALATVDLSAFLYIGPSYPWGIRVGGRYQCYKPVVELKDGTGVVGYVTMPRNSCRASADGDVVLHLTRIKPT